jgi:multicomponent Na+:H+ antiporter subunit E
VTRSWPVAGVLFGVLWVFVHGPSLEPDPLAGSLLVGLAVGFPVAYLFRRLYTDVVDLPRSLRGLPYAVLYVLTFARVAVVSSLDVAYRVLAPSRPIEPEVILIPLRVGTDLGVTTIANSITMTPGSLTLDYDPEENALYVHVIDGRDPDDIVEPIRGWEDYALAIFDEELSPGAPAPDFAVYPPDRTHPVLEEAAPEPEDEREADAQSSTGSEPETEPRAEAGPGGDDDGR